MHFKSIASVALFAGASLVSAQTGEKGDAPVTTGNSDTVVYEAHIKSANVAFGHVNFTGTDDGKGVRVTACFSGINPDQAGPYPYHVHDFQVGAGDNCTATGAHLDPYIRGEEPPCDSKKPETCQVGDLSGKHGRVDISAQSDGTWCTSYVDEYLSLVSTDNAFVGNERSIVIHNVNKTRIGCGNIELASSDNSASPTYTGMNTTTTGTPPIATGGASRVGASGLALGVIIAFGAMLI